jgi:predicted NAD-dependent protein-ADP-ribosyltransferase YbiA (DUF1768 family)
MTTKVHENHWMKNEYRCDVNVFGFLFPSVEHAYQAMKTKDIDVWEKIAEANIHEAREIGKSLTLPDGWDDNRKAVMLQLTRVKYNSSADLAEKLSNVTLPIVMEGYDDFWGGSQNVMGEVLTEIRNEIVSSHLLKENLVKDYLLEYGHDSEFATACQKLFDAAEKLHDYIYEEEVEDYFNNIDVVENLSDSLDEVAGLVDPDYDGCDDNCDCDEDEDEEGEDYEDEDEDEGFTD